MRVWEVRFQSSVFEFMAVGSRFPFKGVCNRPRKISWDSSYLQFYIGFYRLIKRSLLLNCKLLGFIRVFFAKAFHKA